MAANPAPCTTDPRAMYVRSWIHPGSNPPASSISPSIRPLPSSRGPLTTWKLQSPRGIGRGGSPSRSRLVSVACGSSLSTGS